MDFWESKFQQMEGRLAECRHAVSIADKAALASALHHIEFEVQKLQVMSAPWPSYGVQVYWYRESLRISEVPGGMGDQGKAG